MSIQHLLRWTLLRIPILRGLFFILFITYALLPENAPGQKFLGYIALGYASGLAVLAIPAFILFFILMVPIAISSEKDRNRDNALDDTQYVLMTNLTGIGGIIILIFYLANFHSELPWAVWVTSIFAMAEIALFVWQGKSEGKESFYKIKLLSSVGLYGLGIFYLIATDGNLRSPLLNHRAFYIAVICHMILETLVFKMFSRRSLQKASN